MSLKVHILFIFWLNFDDFFFSGNVLGRRVLQLRICTAPKRDLDQDEKKYDKNAAKTVLNMPPAPKLGAKKEAFWVLVSIPYSKELSSVRNLVLFLIFYHFISWAEISSIIYGFHELFACASCLRKWFASMSTFVIFLSFMKSYDVFLQIFWFRKWFPTGFRFVIFF